MIPPKGMCNRKIIGGNVLMDNIDLLVTLTQHERDSNNVTIAFTMGRHATQEGHDVELILLSDAVHLASKGYDGN